MVEKEQWCLGNIWASRIRFEEAVAELVSVAERGLGGYVVTPNVDHIVLAEENSEFVEAYRAAAYSLLDGMPLVWLLHRCGYRDVEKISGSDLAEPLLKAAYERGLRIYCLGGGEQSAARAEARLAAKWPGFRFCGYEAPPFGFEKEEKQDLEVLQRIQAAKPHLLLVCLGAPKQELWMYRHRQNLPHTLSLGLGATLEFLAGEKTRSPAWMSRWGLEWFYRLGQEPGRLFYRYLVRDMRFVPIAYRMLIDREKILKKHSKELNSSIVE